MTKKIILEVPIGETEWVDTPMVFSTPIGDFDKLVKVLVHNFISNFNSDVFDYRIE